VIEVDGYRFHQTKRAFEDDRRKHAKLQIAGCRVVRITDQRIAHGLRRLVDDVRRLLGSAPAA
jgi:very-short-patch-repair endonuclease